MSRITVHIVRITVRIVRITAARGCQWVMMNLLIDQLASCVG